MNIEILNAKQAFEAMSSGKSVLCRAVGQLLDFSELSQFPATVFFGSDYEFCFAPRFMTIGQLDLEVPECLQGFDDIADAAMYYAPNLLNVDRPIEILSTTDNTSYLKRLIVLRLLHRTSVDAIAHARAFITLNGGSLDAMETETIEVKTTVEQKISTEPSVTETKKRQSKKKIAEPEQFANRWSCNLADAPAQEPKKHAFTVDDVEAIEEDPVKIIEKFTAQINACTATGSVLELRHSFAANGHLDDAHVHHLMRLVEDKCLELDPEQYTPKIEIISQENVTASEDNLSPVLTTSKVQGEIEANYQMTLDALDTCVNEQEVDVVSDIKNMQFSVEQIENIEKARDLKIIALRTIDLVDQADKASTPTEANALIRYTKSWTEEQRKPVMTAINKRLVELAAINPVEITQPPSLMVQIQNAQDLTELDGFEIDIASRHPDIQPKLMGLVKQRRFELENQAAQAEVTS